LNPGPHGAEPWRRRVLECPSSFSGGRLNSNGVAFVSFCDLSEPSVSGNPWSSCDPASYRAPPPGIATLAGFRPPSLSCRGRSYLLRCLPESAGRQHGLHSSIVGAARRPGWPWVPDMVKAHFSHRRSSCGSGNAHWGNVCDIGRAFRPIRNSEFATRRSPEQLALGAGAIDAWVEWA